MSTLLFSASPRPLVSSGIADVSPPLPVVVATPAPVLLNHSSSVKVCAPSVGAAPNVTRSSTPSNCSAYSGAALTTANPIAVRNELDKKAGGHYYCVFADASHSWRS